MEEKLIICCTFTVSGSLADLDQGKRTESGSDLCSTYTVHCPKYLATFRDIEGNVTAKKLYT